MTSGAGWTELRAGRWEAARAAFAELPQTAESLEGLSWAAWWLDDAETVFDAHERAYRLYREEGNAAGMATAAALAGEPTIPISSAWTCCFLVSACTSAR